MNKRGFSLIELLVVISIIGTLSTLAVVSFTNSRSKGRDTVRFSNVRAIQEAVELYIENNSLSPDPPEETWTSLESLVGFSMEGGALPLDPKSSEGYPYIYCHSGHEYLIAAVLENNQEIQNDIDNAHNYTINSECIFSQGADLNLDCADTDGGGALGVKTGSVFCVGYAKQ